MRGRSNSCATYLFNTKPSSCQGQHTSSGRAILKAQTESSERDVALSWVTRAPALDGRSNTYVHQIEMLGLRVSGFGVPICAFFACELGKSAGESHV